MLLNIALFILGMILGAGFGIMWCNYQLEKAMKEEITEIFIDVKELKKQIGEDKQ